MKGSGLSDIFLEVGLVGQVSLDGVMSGRYYERAMSCHKTILECLKRRLLEQYLKHAETENIFTDLPPDSLVQLTAFLSKPSKASLESVISDEAIHGYISSYMAYCKDVQEGRMGKTAQLWITYMDHIHLLLSLVESVYVQEGRMGKTAQLWITYMDHIHLLLSLVESV